MMSVRIHDKIVRDKMGRMVTQIPKANQRQARKIADLFRKRILSRAKQYLNKFTGRLFRSLKRVVPGRGAKNTSQYLINLPKYAHYLDVDMNHYVSLNNPDNYPITRWADRKMGPNHPPFIYVRQKPIIRRPIQEASREMRTFTRGGGEVGKEIRRIFG